MNVHTVKINLQIGDVEIEYTDALLEQIKDRYNLGSVDAVTDSLIKKFLTTELSSALMNVNSESSTTKE